METTKPSLPGVTVLIKEAWALYQEKFWLLIGVAAVPSLLTLLAGVAAAAFSLSMENFPTGGMLIAVIIGVIILIVASIWSEAALLTVVVNRSHKFTEAFMNGRILIIPLFLAGLLCGIITLGGTILLIVPGIIFATWFSLYSFALVDKNLKPVDALKTSKRYVVGRTSKVLWKWIVPGIAYVAVTILLKAILSMFGLDKDMASSLGGAILGVLVAPLWALYGFRLYSYAKEDSHPASV